MNLPKLETPKYQLTVPSTQKDVSFRPFLVKEEKILLIAQETGEESNMIKAMRDIIVSCTFEEVDANSLTSFDLEYIFLQIRAKSVGEDAKIGVKCDECEKSHEIRLDLDKISLTKEKPLPKKIQLTDAIGIIPQYIKLDDMIGLAGIEDQGLLLTKTISASVQSIYDDTNVYPISEASEEDVKEFIDSLNREQMGKIEEVFNSTPKLQETIEFNCSGCGAENSHTLKGIESFFV